MENKSAEEVLAPIEIPQDMRSAAWDYAMAKMPDGFNLNTCNQHSKDQFYDHYYLYIISTHGDNQWNAALEGVKKEAKLVKMPFYDDIKYTPVTSKEFELGNWVLSIHEKSIDNLKK